MRLPGNLPRRLSAGISFLFILVVLVALLPAGPAVAADTGTYRIDSYTVTLRPNEDGTVDIDYSQNWTVLSGTIPWVTVGLPNRYYDVTGHSDAATKVYHNDGGGFTGVRIDLDRSYTAGEAFTVGFSVRQERLLERLPDEGIWRIDFTPGWYDRAAIGELTVMLSSPVDTASFTTLTPPPSQTGTNALVWERTNLTPGARFEILMESVDGSFLAEGAGVVDQGGGGGINWSLIIGVVVVLILVALVVRIATRDRQKRLEQQIDRAERDMAEDEAKKKEYEAGFEKYVEEKNIEPDEDGRYYDRTRGRYITPAIWAAIIANRYTYNRPYVGGGYRSNTGCVSCACVSCACACACACAGGGAAGCARKTLHECPACRELLTLKPGSNGTNS
jgi:uncharacterized membrane protein